MKTPNNQSNVEKSLKIYWPFVLVASFIGFLLSWGVLAGDQQGRVNLFYLLLLYLVLPIASLLISIISLLFGRGINFSRVLSDIPIWSFNLASLNRKLNQFDLDKHWFFMQSQMIGIAFSVSSLSVFFLLLLATDLNFIWRSTLLNSDDIYPILKFIASPWYFWQAAQPSLDLLQVTQDFRLNGSNIGSSNMYGSNISSSIYAAWWPFVLATQVFYSIILRLIFFVAARFWIIHSFKKDVGERLGQNINQAPNKINAVAPEIKIINEIPHDISINNWSDVPLEILNQLNSELGSGFKLNLDEDNLLIAGPKASFAQQSVAERWQGAQLLIVKAWEPPMGELQDFLENGRGFLLPLDWSKGDSHKMVLIKPDKKDLQEWYRFIQPLSRWRLYLPKSLLAEGL